MAGPRVIAKFRAIDEHPASAGATGDKTIVSAVTGMRIRVMAVSIVVGGAATLRWKSGGGSSLSGDMDFAANGGYSNASDVGLLQTAFGEGLVLNVGAAQKVSGCLAYIEV